jgi:hypothetical protein
MTDGVYFGLPIAVIVVSPKVKTDFDSGPELAVKGTVMVLSIVTPACTALNVWSLVASAGPPMDKIPEPGFRNCRGKSIVGSGGAESIQGENNLRRA